MKADRWFLALVLAFASAFVLARLPVLLTSPEVRKGGEELLVGVLPFHLMQGLVLPISRYQQEAYAGGTVVTGLVAYPFFRLLGPNYFALKLTALLFALASGILFLVLVRRLAGTSAAALFAALYVVAPPLLQQHQVITYGNHAELNFFLATALLLVTATIRGDGGAGLGLALGLVSGFALYFDYAFAVFLLVLAGAWVRWGGARARTLASFVPAAIAGLIPWFIFHNRWNVAAELGEMFVGRKYGWGKPGAGPGAWVSVLEGFGGGAKLPLAATWSATIYLATAAVLCVAGLIWEARAGTARDDTDEPRDARPAVFRILLAYVVLYVVVEEAHRLFLRDQAFRPRYLAAAWPAALVVLALALDRLWAARRALGVLALAALLVPCALEGWRLTGKAAARDLLAAPGYDYQYFFADVLRPRLGFGDDGVTAVRREVQAVAGGPEEVLDEGFLAGVGNALGFRQGGRMARYCPDAAACDPRFAVAAGAGSQVVRSVVRRSGGDCPPPIAEDACRRGHDLAAAALAAYRRAPGTSR